MDILNSPYKILALLLLVFLTGYFAANLASDIDFNNLSNEKTALDSSNMREDRRDFAQNLVNQHFPDSLKSAVEKCNSLEEEGNCIYYLSFFYGH